MTKPFTLTVDHYDMGETTSLHINTSLDMTRLFIGEYRGNENDGRHEYQSITLDRAAAKWLRKQLKKALNRREPCE